MCVSDLYSNTDNLFSLLQIIHSNPVHQKRQNLKKRIYQVSSLLVLPYSANILNFVDLLKLILILKKISWIGSILSEILVGNPRNLQPLKILRCTVEHVTLKYSNANGSYMRGKPCTVSIATSTWYITSCRFYNLLEERAQNTKKPYKNPTASCEHLFGFTNQAAYDNNSGLMVSLHLLLLLQESEFSLVI